MGLWFWMNSSPRHKSQSDWTTHDARRRVLAEWRGADFEPLERARAQAARPAAQVLTRVLAELRLDRRRTDVEVLKAWNQLLDPNITAHACPTRLHEGTLFVNVDNSVWLSEIVRYRRQEILEALQHCFGHDLIARISFRIG